MSLNDNGVTLDLNMVYVPGNKKCLFLEKSAWDYGKTVDVQQVFGESKVGEKVANKIEDKQKIDSFTQTLMCSDVPVETTESKDVSTTNDKFDKTCTENSVPSRIIVTDPSCNETTSKQDENKEIVCGDNPTLTDQKTKTEFTALTVEKENQPTVGKSVTDIEITNSIQLSTTDKIVAKETNDLSQPCNPTKSTYFSNIDKTKSNNAHDVPYKSPINIPKVNIPQASFYYHMEGAKKPAKCKILYESKSDNRHNANKILILCASARDDKVKSVVKVPVPRLKLQETNRVHRKSETSINIPAPQRSRTVHNLLNKVYTSADKCAEVMHAQTPITSEECRELQAQIPQLPIPSPNYPLHFESSNCHSNVQITSLPNNHVPTSYLITETSQQQQRYVISSSKTHSVDLTKANDPKFRMKLQDCDSNAFTVLNIPNLQFGHVPTAIKRRAKMSRIEFAMKKRRKRKESRQTVKTKKSPTSMSVVTMEWGVPVVGYESDTSSSWNSSDYDSDVCDVDLDIKSGPPEKPSTQKVSFLNRVGLATPAQRNSVEIKKIEDREWMSPWMFTRQEVENREIAPLDLPVPSINPAVLNTCSDYKYKKLFLNSLGLRNFDPNDRKEFEQAWVKVIHDRLKRDCETPLTKYSIKAYRKQQFGILQPFVPKQLSVKAIPMQDLMSVVPIVHQYAQLGKKDSERKIGDDKKSRAYKKKLDVCDNIGTFCLYDKNLDSFKRKRRKKY